MSVAFRELTESKTVLRRAAPAATGLLAVAAVVETVQRQAGGLPGALTLLLCLLALASTVPLLLDPPVQSALAVTGSGVLSLAAFDRLTLAGIIAALACSYRLGRNSFSPGAMLLGIGYLALAAVQRPGAPIIGPLLAGLVPTAVGIGLARQLRRDTLQHRSVHAALVDTRVEHAVRVERARIAREMHDVVAHHISMIAVQAEAARLTVPDMPVAAVKRLAAIGDTARSALTAMRRLLGVLRAEAPGPEPERQPQPGLAQLNELLDQARESTGSTTRLILTGTPVPLDPAVELAAFRIIQEALTNARRHAGGAAVDVELHFSTTSLRLMVRDNGPGPTSDESGHGLLGMRERAAAVGGRLVSRPGSTGGFVVESTLPASGRDRL